MTTPLRFVTAASLFDGHDASINIMRRLLQSQGAEVIHLGHNRSAQEVVDTALQEDAHAIALSSYQGGHMEYFTYIRELLDQAGAQSIRIFGGGGGVITPPEIKKLHSRGIERIYSPEDGQKLGLEGIIQDMLERAKPSEKNQQRKVSDFYDLAKTITRIEEQGQLPAGTETGTTPVVGITGTGGAGKSSLIDELFLRFHLYYPDKKVALISVDPTKKKTQGALLGDRIRLGSVSSKNFYVRSLATRGSGTELSPHLPLVLKFLKAQDFDVILVETSGIGQAADSITEVSDKSVYVMTPEFGAQTQLEKIEMLEAADYIVLNKFEKPRSEDALKAIRKQYRRNHKLFETPADEELPIYGTMASHFNDKGINALFSDLMGGLGFGRETLKDLPQEKYSLEKPTIIPVDRIQYLRDIAKACRQYNAQAEIKKNQVESYEALKKSEELLENKTEVRIQKEKFQQQIGNETLANLGQLQKTIQDYRSETFKQPTKYTSLSHSKISRVGLPHYTSLADLYSFMATQNIPGSFPFAAGIFPFKRKDEEPKRQFAGEGGPKRTNKRFHYLSQDDSAKRLSTAFDSVTLYGEDPHERPDIYGKVGESGVSICTLEDMEDLYAGFKLTDPNTSVSKTINGPAPIILAMFMNTAINQELSVEERNDPKKCLEVMQNVRGTVQADILKEDQAQNTCIFSLEFALRMMGDVQAFFSQNLIRKYYTVSISGYHIAEAGANPITQLAFTLANGFTYVEYYLSRGIPIDSFCENLSFFFSNGLDPEYSVIGRVARKIWAVTMRDKYGANLKSQKLKYHIQTSGRSLHAQEIDFNDIRTTLQAFLALSDNCNSLHTNAYDEAITTPTEESVRRAMAIQLIINREFGLNKTDNPLQGSFIYDELADLVEEAVLSEFERISDKGGVLGAMESMYQRSQIQEESLYYESLKNSGELPLIGVNTYLNKNRHKIEEIEMTRAATTEKDEQIQRLRAFQQKHKDKSEIALARLRDVALKDENIFEELLQTVRVCSLGQITQLLHHIGGRYRRSL